MDAIESFGFPYMLPFGSNNIFIEEVDDDRYRPFLQPRIDEEDREDDDEELTMQSWMAKFTRSPPPVEKIKAKPKAKKPLTVVEVKAEEMEGFKGHQAIEELLDFIAPEKEAPVKKKKPKKKTKKTASKDSSKSNVAGMGKAESGDSDSDRISIAESGEDSEEEEAFGSQPLPVAVHKPPPINIKPMEPVKVSMNMAQPAASGAELAPPSPFGVDSEPTLSDSVETPVPANDVCSHLAIAKMINRCPHCETNFCSNCTIRHAERIRQEILNSGKLGKSEVQQEKVDELNRKYMTELERTRAKIDAVGFQLEQNLLAVVSETKEILKRNALAKLLFHLDEANQAFGPDSALLDELEQLKNTPTESLQLERVVQLQQDLMHANCETDVPDVEPVSLDFKTTSIDFDLIRNEILAICL